jgi:glycosyltransferase involved in cell wall biosynthesis
MAKVSIIIPTYNVADYLVECMDSVIRQTLDDLEIICINDGSTDNSLEILKSYGDKDKRIKIVDKANEGYGIGMNIGLEHSTGEYIGIVEPDDFISLTMYEDLYIVAKENDLDFVKADFYRFVRNAENENMHLVYNHLSWDEKWYNKVLNSSEEPELLRLIMNTWSGIYKREFIERHKIRHNTTPGASFQDNGFWFQTFCYAKRVMFIDKPYYYNRRDNPNSSVKSKEKVYCMNVEYDHIRDILMKDEELWKRFKFMYSYRKYHNYLATLERIDPGFHLDYCKRFAAEYRRALDMDELDKNLFSPNEWSRLMSLIDNPENYYMVFYRLGQSTLNTKAELDNLRNSTTYKVGRLIMYLPCRIKESFVRKRKS